MAAVHPPHPFLHVMASRAGRLMRIIVGTAFIVVGLVLHHGWLTLAVGGVVALTAGLADICLLAPLAKHPLRGSELRQSIGDQPDAPLW